MLEEGAFTANPPNTNRNSLKQRNTFTVTIYFHYTYVCLISISINLNTSAPEFTLFARSVWIHRSGSDYFFRFDLSESDYRFAQKIFIKKMKKSLSLALDGFFCWSFSSILNVQFLKIKFFFLGSMEGKKSYFKYSRGRISVNLNTGLYLIILYFRCTVNCKVSNLSGPSFGQYFTLEDQTIQRTVTNLSYLWNVLSAERSVV